MAVNIDDWFQDIYVSEVHLAYQRMGSQLEGLVRSDGQGSGYRVKFPKLGTATVGTKARNAEVTLNERDEDHVWVNLADYYTGDLIDDLDLLRTDVNVRQSYATTQSAALGRQVDDLIIDAFDECTGQTADGGAVITLDNVMEAFTYLGDNDVPADDMRYFVTSPKGWTDLMQINEFASADWVPQNEMPFRGGSGTMKRWFSFYVFTHSGLPKTGDDRLSFLWHKSAIGFKKMKDVGVRAEWENLRQAYSLVGSVTAGAGLIDDNGIYSIIHDETATPA